jgi:hypothetical protein
MKQQKWLSAEDNGNRSAVNKSVYCANHSFDREVVTMLSAEVEHLIVVVSWDETGQVLEVSDLLEGMTRLRIWKQISRACS